MILFLLQLFSLLQQKFCEGCDLLVLKSGCSFTSQSILVDTEKASLIFLSSSELSSFQSQFCNEVPKKEAIRDEVSKGSVMIMIQQRTSSSSSRFFFLRDVCEEFSLISLVSAYNIDVITFIKRSTSLVLSQKTMNQRERTSSSTRRLLRRKEETPLLQFPHRRRILNIMCSLLIVLSTEFQGKEKRSRCFYRIILSHGSSSSGTFFLSNREVLILSLYCC